MKQGTATSPSPSQPQRDTTIPNQREATVSGAAEPERTKSSRREDVSKQLQTSARPAPTPSASQTRPDHERIRQRAYELYMERGCQDGRAEEDWLEAEFEILGATKSQQES